jgi:hypothetical protein
MAYIIGGGAAGGRDRRDEMGGRYGRGKEAATRPQRVSPETEERLRESDARYLLESRRRMRDRSTRTWIIRLAVVVAVLTVIRLWGIEFLNATLLGRTTHHQTRQTPFGQTPAHRAN